MQLQKLGGRYQLVIECADDLVHIATLDQALWAATSAPIESLTCDPVFLKCVDSDQNGRIRADEIRAAQAWLFRMLVCRSRLTEKATRLHLDDIDVSHEEGRALRAAAERILANIGSDNATEIDLEQVRNRQQILASAAANGDGVIPPEAVDDEALVGFIRDILATVGGVEDASGLQGVSGATLDAFLAEAQAHLDWHAQGRDAAVRVWGEDTDAAYSAYQAVAERIDHYFLLCAVTCLDADVAERTAHLPAVDLTDAAAMEAHLRSAPLATPVPEQRLTIDDKINPLYRDALRTFYSTVIARGAALPTATLTRSEWEVVKKKLAPYQAWQDAKAGAAVEALGEETLRRYVAGELPERLRALIHEDEAARAELEQMHSVEKLILYQQWLFELANNFVAFPRLYDPFQRSLVELGTLILDGRHFTLNVRVTDRAAHKKIAEESHICLLYLQVKGKEATDTFEIATAVTAGTTKTLWPGKRGIFFGTDGREYDALVVDVIDNPVGLWEAVQRPFKRLAEFAGKQAERFSTARYTELEKQIDKGVADASKTVDTKPGTPLSPTTQAAANRAKAGTVRDLLMGGSVAVAALGGTLALISSTIEKMKNPFTILSVLLALLLLVAVPTLVVALVKLRRRNLATLLEACGWAMNGQLKLTSRIGKLFTRIPLLPAGAKRRRLDLAKLFASRLPKLGISRETWLDWLVWLVLFLLALGAVLVWLPGLR